MFCYFTRFIASVLLLAWNVLGYANADEAEITAMNSSGFVMKMKVRHFYSNSPVEITETYEFSGELCTLEAISQEFSTLSYSSRFACWPPGPSSIVAIALLVSALVSSIDFDSPLASVYYRNIKYFSLLVYQTPQIAQIVLGVILLSHACEVLYVFNIFRRLQMTSLQTSTWFVLVMILGYGATSRIIHLDKFSRSEGQKNVKVD